MLRGPQNVNWRIIIGIDYCNSKICNKILNNTINICYLPAKGRSVG